LQESKKITGSSSLTAPFSLIQLLNSREIVEKITHQTALQARKDVI
jgi:hypothetical protein